jgi:tRNA threonylcarbamoyladenosine biosynthesis protein TsaB
MLILGIDTATQRSSVALCAGTDVLVATYSDRPRRHGEFVGPAIAYCLNDAGVNPFELDVIAVDVGPGLYTGMRVGIGVAQTLASATAAQTVAVTSTDALAYAVRHVDGDVLVALDGRRGEVFLASYTVTGGVVTAVLAPCVLPYDVAATHLRTSVVAVVGDGFSTETLDTHAVAPEARLTLLPQAVDVAGVAAMRAATGMLTSPDALTPVYLRHADAKIGWETRGKLVRDGGA